MPAQHPTLPPQKVQKFPDMQFSKGWSLSLKSGMCFNTLEYYTQWTNPTKCSKVTERPNKFSPWKFTFRSRVSVSCLVPPTADTDPAILHSSGSREEGTGSKTKGRLRARTHSVNVTCVTYSHRQVNASSTNCRVVFT